ncbi:uncharacterized protein E5676_scaffold195G001260 [Cucumis melo var. makuwa]|uniref:Uncharacterized protein n=1 Tax=Cucumis melo var. makuwa TaxID=1194695 RepID=A0A5D3DH62_CUCMM|nr:uncharacterized protein E5676_scaffold195G001260 [Cucumis melo var. makuwa]
MKKKSKRIDVGSMEKPKENESKGKEVEQININDNEAEFDIFKERALIKMPMEREVVCELISILPIALNLILRYATKVMEQDSSITIHFL